MQMRKAFIFGTVKCKKLSRMRDKEVTGVDDILQDVLK
jgi:hypothetical protein